MDQIPYSEGLRHCFSQGMHVEARGCTGMGAYLLPVHRDHVWEGCLTSQTLRTAFIDIGAALLEPAGRNTAPALTLAALAAQQGGADPVLVVTPAGRLMARIRKY